MAGNLRILISDDESEDESTDKGQGHQNGKEEPEEHVFKGLEATIVAEFTEGELHKLAREYHCLITREPSFGQADVLRIKPPNSKYTADIKTSLDNIRRKLTQIQKRELHFSEENLKKVKEFEGKILEEKRGTVLYINNLDKKVTVVGEKFECVNETEHALKVLLGHIKPNNRAQRQLSTDNCDASIVKEERSNTASSQSGNRYQANRTDDFEINFNGNFTLRVYKASITDVQVDVIVNAANDNLMHGGGVAQVIAKAAGYKLDSESKKYINRYGLIEVTKNCLTCAGSLRYDAVIHAVGPQWVNYRDKVDCLNDVYWTVFNVLTECENRSYTSVGIPAISAGIYGVPKELCADMYVKAAVDFSEKNPRHLKEMHFIDVDMEILKLVKDSVAKWEKDPKKIDQKYSVPAYMEPYSRQRPYNSYGKGKNDRRARTFESQASVEDDVGRDGLPCSVEENTEEKFKWGGEAKVFLVGGAVIVKIFKADIEKTSNMDALVCGIDTTLTSFGFIAQTLEKAGGRKYNEGLSDIIRYASYADKQINAVLKSNAGDLGVRYVIHLVNKRFTFAAREEEVKVYKQGIYQVLKKAKKWGIKSLVLPMIGTGNIQKDEAKLKRCGFALLNAICTFCHEEDEQSVTEIHLVNNTKLVCDALVSVFRQASGNPVRSSTRNKDTSPATPYDNHRGYRDHDGGHSKPSRDGDSEGKRSRHDNDGSKHRQRNDSYDKDKSNSCGKGRDHGGGRAPTNKRSYSAEGKIYDNNDTHEDNTTDRWKKHNHDYEDMDVENVDTEDTDDSGSKSNETKPRGNLVIFED